MDKKLVLFEAVVDLVVSFLVVAVAFRIMKTVPATQFVLWLAVAYTLFGAFMDTLRRKERIRVLACGLATFLGTVAAGAVTILLK